MSQVTLRVQLAIEGDWIHGWVEHGEHFFRASVHLPLEGAKGSPENVSKITAALDEIGRSITISVGAVTGCNTLFHAHQVAK